MNDASLPAGIGIRERLDAIVARAAEYQWEAIPGLRQSLGPAQVQHTVTDLRFHLEFLASSLWAGRQELFEDYVRWVKVLFGNLRLPDSWISSSLDCCRRAVIDQAPPDVAAVAVRYLDRGLACVSERVAPAESFMIAGQPLGGLALRYLGAVLGGDRHGAVSLVREAVEAGTPVRDVYRWVYQPVQCEIGRLWHLGEITVAQEHFATAVTQLSMAQLYSRIFATPKNGKVLVAACVGSELHELGVRMVADHFELMAWDTHYLGANVPARSVATAVAERHADMVALSATMAFHLEEVAATIAEIRRLPEAAGAHILVGGYPFNLAPALWQRVGADGTAPDADGAVALAASLIGADSERGRA